MLAAPLRKGEAITDRRFIGSSLADAHPELTVLPLRLPDAAVVELLRVGDRIDLSSVDPETGEGTVLATEVLVLAIPPPATTDSTEHFARASAERLMDPLEWDAALAETLRSVEHFEQWAGSARPGIESQRWDLEVQQTERELSRLEAETR